MKIRTKVDVTYNAPSKVHGTESGIVEGFIINTSWLEDFTVVGANYLYAKPDGTLIKQGGFTVSGEDIETLYTAIKPSIPTDENYKDTERTTYYLAFIVEMAQTFGLDTSQIELVP